MEDKGIWSALIGLICIFSSAAQETEKQKDAICFNNPSWFRFGEQCYYIHSNPDDPPHLLTFDEAERYCRSQHAALASIHSEEEHSYIISKIQSEEYKWYWIGLSRKGKTRFEWTDGSPVDFERWARSEPNNDNGMEMCVDFHTAHGAWNDRHCGMKLRFICKRPLSPNQAIPNPPHLTLLSGKCPEGWTSMGSKCFKLFGQKEDERMTFMEAMNQCRSMGDNHDLVSVHTPEEQIFLGGVMHQSPSHAWIGLRFLGRYVWTDNTDTSLYFNWGDGEPSRFFNYTAEDGNLTAVPEECVELWQEFPHRTKTGKWNDNNCESKNAYICARPSEKIPTCLKPQTPKYTKISVERVDIDAIHLCSQSGYFEVGTILKYRCISGYYELEGKPERECLNTGEWSGAQPRCLPVCGLAKDPKNPLIIHGRISNVGDWPWQVAIRDLTENVRHLICGGTVISDEWVLTAAHCVTEKHRTTVRRQDDLELQYGKHYYNMDDQQVVRAKVQQIIVHDQYSPHTLDFDIALIRSRRIIEFNERIRPACLPDPMRGFRSRVANQNKGIVSGWGTTETSNPATQLKYAVLQIVANEECQRLLNAGQGSSSSRSAELEEFERRKRRSPSAHQKISMTNNMFCAGSEEGWACSGDSGGPMVMNHARDGDQPQWVVEGVVSWGQSICRSNRSAYTRVENFLPWIHKFTGA